MKIMYLLFSFTVGGTERLVTNICNQMCNTNNDIYLYIVNDLVDQSLLMSLDKRVHVELLGRTAGSKDRIRPLILISKFIKKNKIDVVHCNSFNAPELLVLSKVFNPKCRIIITIHGLNQFKGINKIRLFIKKNICNKFIAVSDAVKSDIIHQGIPMNKSIRVYNGIETTRFDIAIRKEIDKEKPVIGCVARIMPSEKGQDILLEATEILKNDYPNILVLFAGGVAEKQKDEYLYLEKLVKDKNIGNNIKFLGIVNNIPDFLNQIDICVVPSRSEGFGLALVEALCMGVPCIASNIEGPKEIIENEKIGIIFKVNDPEDLAQQISNTIKNFPSLKEEYWNKRNTIKNTYGIKNMCDQLIKIYNGTQ